MERDKIIQQLIDFCEGRGGFEARNDYVGIEASSIPDIYIDYFNRLSSADKKKTASIINDGSLAHIDLLMPYVKEIMMLLQILCRRNYVDYFRDGINKLEAEFNNSDNLMLWVNADDKPKQKGSSFKADWHYPLILWGVLYMLKSNRINETYQYLLKNAKSKFFREALDIAKESYDTYTIEPDETPK